MKSTVVKLTERGCLLYAVVWRQTDELTVELHANNNFSIRELLQAGIFEKYYSSLLRPLPASRFFFFLATYRLTGCPAMVQYYSTTHRATMQQWSWWCSA